MGGCLALAGFAASLAKLRGSKDWQQGQAARQGQAYKDVFESALWLPPEARSTLFRTVWRRPIWRCLLGGQAALLANWRKGPLLLLAVACRVARRSLASSLVAGHHCLLIVLQRTWKR